MKVNKRTRKDLEEELEAMRRRVSELEALVLECGWKEQVLLDSQESFRSLSEAAFEGVIIHDKGKILDVNKSFAEIFGYQISELIGMNVLDLCAPEYRELVLKNITSGYDKRVYRLTQITTMSYILVEIFEDCFISPNEREINCVENVFNIFCISSSVASEPLMSISLNEESCKMCSSECSIGMSKVNI